MDIELHVTIMSGVLDGEHFSFNRSNGDGQIHGARWIISVGRQQDCDICLADDMYLSRLHAYIIWDNNQQWLLHDCDSTNGSFLEDGISDRQFKGTIPIRPGQLFKLGRTWMRVDE